jgi:acetyltransferase-like isoleucine patch superfamily enzyme
MLKLINKTKNLFSRFYTLCIKFDFYSFGAKSFIFYPCTIYNPRSIMIGKKVVIREGVWLNVKRKNDDTPALMIGEGCYIGRNTQINAWESVVIEDHVLIADKVFISDADHIYENREVPIIKQGDKFKGKVILSSGCWIGTGAVILPNVKIGKNSVVASNAVVTKDVPDFTIVGGIPAKELKKI